MALPRIHDIARLAGVSTATVDRVLNKRAGVRDLTVQRVLRVARELDYLPPSTDVAPLDGVARAMRITFLLPDGRNRYVRMLGEMVGYSQDRWLPFNVRCKTELVEAFNPKALADALLRHARRADGVAIMAQEHPTVREAVHKVTSGGVPVITLISDLSSSERIAYLGLDNRAAGRTAGYLIGRFIGAKTAKVALIAGSRSYLAHEEREAGFLHVLSDAFDYLEVVGLREGHDDSEQNYQQARSLIDQYPNLAGIYNIGGASDGVARALKEAGLEQRIVLIGHGLTPDTRALLIDGSMDAVITQCPHSTLANAVRIFVNVREGLAPLSGVESTRGQVIFRENLP